MKECMGEKRGKEDARLRGEGRHGQVHGGKEQGTKEKWNADRERRGEERRGEERRGEERRGEVRRGEGEERWECKCALYLHLLTSNLVWFLPQFSASWCWCSLNMDTP